MVLSSLGTIKSQLFINFFLLDIEATCNDPMGLQSGEFLEQQISSSSYASYAFRPDNARLHGTSAWTPAGSNEYQYLEVCSFKCYY